MELRTSLSPNTKNKINKQKKNPTKGNPYESLKFHTCYTLYLLPFLTLVRQRNRDDYVSTV